MDYINIFIKSILTFQRPDTTTLSASSKIRHLWATTFTRNFSIG